MKIIKLSILLLFLVSCQKKEVQLPQLGEKGVTGVYNTSKIWIFFDVVKGDTVGILNKNNKIANTNMIFNIDKRLPVREVFPKVMKVKHDALNALVHKTVGKQFYLSYADTVSNTFALYDFTDTKYIFTPEEIRTVLDTIKKNPVMIDIKKNEILINNTRTNNLSDSLQNIFINDSLHQNTLFLKFQDDISYSEYLSLRSQFYNDGYAIENIEYIYNEE